MALFDTLGFFNPGLSAVRDLPDIKDFNLSDSMRETNHDA
jgi:hypothetical protein